MNTLMIQGNGASTRRKNLRRTGLGIVFLLSISTGDTWGLPWVSSTREPIAVETDSVESPVRVGASRDAVPFVRDHICGGGIFTSDGTADACEPDFSLCLPNADASACEGACPGPLPCTPSIVRVNVVTGQQQILECSCRTCRVCTECESVIPPCTQGCPAGSGCAHTLTCYTNEICDVECTCEEQGAWDPPFDWGLPGKLIVPIHAAVVPVRDASGRLRGHVLAYDDHVEDGHLHTYRWDPESGTFTQFELPVIDVVRDCPTPRPPAQGNLFCSGHSLLADGKVLVTGGHIVAADLYCSNGYAFSGHVSAHTFDSLAAGSADPWARVPDMRQGRWYPTNCTLADGRILTASGFDACGYCDGSGNPVVAVNPDVEIYTPPSPFSAGPGRFPSRAGGWTLAGQQYFPLYPWFHLLSNGAIFYSGPGTDSRLSNPPYASWPLFAYSMLFPFRGAGTSVLLPGRPDSVMILGGGCTGCGPYPATTDTSEIADVFSLAPPHWDAGPTMNHPRRHLNAVLLPDGTVLAVGGRSDSEDPQVDPVLPVYEAELYDPLGAPGLGWQRMAAMTKPRMYHSTALLLPDGRVLSAGGTYVNPSYPSEPNAEIYYPPYLFRGPRPVIMDAPENVGYGQEFSVLTPSPSEISSVVLMRPGAVTHSVNMEQRYVALPFELSAIPEGLQVTAPANGNLAPPGYYMLFILNAQRVPSEAVIIHLTADEACCLGAAGDVCQSLPPEQCTAMGGTPLGPGTVCLGDNNMNGIDDACESQCAPNPAGNACNPNTCPNLQHDCVPTLVKCTPSGAVCTIIECTCQNPNLCHIDLPPGSPLPACFGGCPPDAECKEIITIDPDDGQFLHTCRCVALEACCLVSFDVTCQMLTSDECISFGGVPQGPNTTCLGHEACCLPDGSCTFVDAICCDDLGGTSQGSGSMCPNIAPGPCCYDITDDFCIYDTCVNDQNLLCCEANGGIGLGDDYLCLIEACCIDGLCCDIDPACCQFSGGVPGGAGSSCAGVQGACCYDGDGDSIPEVCIIADAACCSDLGGNFHGEGSTCSPNFGACCFGFTGGSCIEMNESCCADLEAGTFQGPGSVCLGDNNGNGLDDACEPGACQPHPSGMACTGQCLPNEFCRPTKVRREIDGRHHIIECECLSTFGPTCHVELNPNDPVFAQPTCDGFCPAGEVCDLVSSGNVQGIIDYMCVCRDNNVPIPCGPNPQSDACVGSCPPDLACVPTVVHRDPVNPGLEVVVSCDCLNPLLCRTALDNSGDPNCLGFCPGPLACNPYAVPTPAFGEFVQCACFTEACCFPSGRCRPLPPELCRAAGGMPQGPGTRCRVYADVFPKPDGDGEVDLDDILKVLDGFADPFMYPHADIYPCAPDGEINLDDILAVLDAFAGFPACSDAPCP